MNKKLLLLPVILMSSALSACAVKIDHVTLKEMYDTTKFSGYASYSVVIQNKGSGFGDDTDHKVFNLLKEYTYDAEMVGKINDFGGFGVDRYGYNLIEYTFDTPYEDRKMSYFTIRIYNDGVVQTYASGTGDFIYPKEQFTAYKVSESNIDTLFEKVEQCAKDYQRNMAAKEATIENFIDRLTYNRVNDFGLRIQTNEEPPRSFTYDFIDKNGEILNVFKEMKFETFDEEQDVNPYACITVAARSYWRMFIDYKSCYGYMRYQYDSALEDNGYGIIEQYFRVNRPGVTNVYGNLFEKIEDQYQSDIQKPRETV